MVSRIIVIFQYRIDNKPVFWVGVGRCVDIDTHTPTTREDCYLTMTVVYARRTHGCSYLTMAHSFLSGGDGVHNDREAERG